MATNPEDHLDPSITIDPRDTTISSPPLDLVQVARSTKKVIDRLAPFCEIQPLEQTSSPANIPHPVSASPSSSPPQTAFSSPVVTPSPSAFAGLVESPAGIEASPPQTATQVAREQTRIASKIRAKVGKLIAAIDDHMHSAQMGFDMCRVGHEASTEPDPALCRALLKYAREGKRLSEKTEAIFNQVSQEVFKIAAQTKDNNNVVLVPPGHGQAPSLRKPLKEVGLDLVASLSLFTEFGRMVTGTVAWWVWVVLDLETAANTHSSHDISDESLDGGARLLPVTSIEAREWWSNTKLSWQQYYSAVQSLHLQYPDLLQSSITAWGDTEGLEVLESAIIASHSINGAPQDEFDTDEGFVYVQAALYTLPPSFVGRSQSTLRKKLSSSLRTALAFDAHVGGRDGSSDETKMTGFLMWGNAASSRIGEHSLKHGESSKSRWGRRIEREQGLKGRRDSISPNRHVEGDLRLKRPRSLWFRDVMSVRKRDMDVVV